MMKKCIVLDLDNTLWGGVVGEDGADGIALSLAPPGASFIAFQQALRDLHDRGVILAINSRNNFDDAMEVIEKHPNMILKDNHFAAKRINWNDKAQNLRELAEELNIGLDSMVFFDDDKVNREMVRRFLPEVETPELPEDPRKYVKFLHSLPYFKGSEITDEDKMRGNLYVTERLRREAEKVYSDKGEFLKSLGIEVHFFENDASSLARLSQLTEKTNQFNVQKRPLSTEEIEKYILRNDYSVYHARAIDQFGDQGIVAFAIVEKGNKEWNIESLLMSCRVIGRGIEDAFVAEIARRAHKAGAHRLSVVFEKSERNQPAATFVENFFGPERFITSDRAHVPEWITIV